VDGTVPGLGTLINMTTIVLGSLAGIAVGHRLRERPRSVVTDSLGLVTLLVAALSAISVTDPALVDAVPSGAPVLEDRLAGLGGRVHDWTSRRWSGADLAGRATHPRGPAGRLDAAGAPRRTAAHPARHDRLLSGQSAGPTVV